jgi:hypothetical protein
MQTTTAGALSNALERWNAGDLDGYLDLYACTATRRSR